MADRGSCYGHSPSGDGRGRDVSRHGTKMSYAPFGDRRGKNDSGHEKNERTKSIHQLETADMERERPGGRDETNRITIYSRSPLNP